MFCYCKFFIKLFAAGVNPTYLHSVALGRGGIALYESNERLLEVQ